MDGITALKHKRQTGLPPGIQAVSFTGNVFLAGLFCMYPMECLSHMWWVDDYDDFTGASTIGTSC